MLITVAVLLASAQTCTDVKRECRACAVTNGKRRCSNIAIACQPSVRVCEPKINSPSAPVSTPKTPTAVDVHKQAKQPKSS